MCGLDFLISEENFKRQNERTESLNIREIITVSDIHIMI